MGGIVQGLVLVLGLLLAPLMWAAGFSFADVPAQADNSFLPVEQAFRPQLSRQGNALHVRFTVAPGYYLYHDRLWLKQGQTPVSGWVVQQPGHIKNDPNFGRVRVYGEQLDITIADGALRDGLVLSWQGCAAAGLCYPPQLARLDVASLQLLPLAGPRALTPVTPAQAEPPRTAEAPVAPAAVPAASATPDRGSAVQQLLQGASLPWLMLGFLVLGLGLAFTPCVFPMVPILAAIIAGSGPVSGRRGLLLAAAYVLGMATAYAGGGAVTGYFGARANLSLLLQQPWAVISFAVLFVLLALAMSGLFELRLPAGLASRLDSMNRRLPGGRHASVFVMGALSALVVSPCVSAPLAGVLLYISSTGDAVLGAVALFCLALGMGVPLLLVGAGGGSLLPRAGAWMVRVRQLFALVLLGMAIWLLARIAPAPLVLALWGLLLFGGALLLGLTDAAASRWSRLLSWPLALWAALALIGSAQGHGDVLAPLASPAPSIQPASPSALASAVAWTTVTQPQQLQELQARSALPVAIDVYADWCTACKDMEHKVYARPDVQQRLQGWTRLRLDITGNTPAQQAWLQQQRLFGPPALLLLDAHGREQQRLLGEVPARTVCHQLAPAEAAGQCGA